MCSSIVLARVRCDTRSLSLSLSPPLAFSLSLAAYFSHITAVAELTNTFPSAQLFHTHLHTHHLPVLLLDATERADTAAGAAARDELQKALAFSKVIVAYIVGKAPCEEEAASECESVADVRARVRAREQKWALVDAAAAKKEQVRAAWELVHRAARGRAAASSSELAIVARMRRDQPFYGAIVATKQENAPWRGMVRVVWREEGWRERGTKTSIVSLSHIRVL